MKYNKYNPRRNSLTKWSCGDDGAVDEDDGDDDPDEARGDDDGYDFPLREGISPTDFSLPESFFSLCCFRPWGGGGIFPWWLSRLLGDAHKYRGSLKSSLGSITQIYSSTRWEHKNIDKTLAIEASLSTTPVYQ